MFKFTKAPLKNTADKASELDWATDQSELTSSRPNAAQEFGGPKGKEPTRYGDWEKNGRCIDF